VEEWRFSSAISKLSASYPENNKGTDWEILIYVKQNLMFLKEKQTNQTTYSRIQIKISGCKRFTLCERWSSICGQKNTDWF
jgi:hypothetical protein